MAKLRFKLGQMLETADEFGKVTEIRIKETGTEYVLDEETVVPEDSVTEVYRRVSPRATRAPKAAKARKTTKTQPEARAA